MLVKLVELLIVAWLPGAAIFRLPCLDRDRRAALDAEERAFWTVAISLAISLGIVLLLAAIGRYSFTRLLLADIIIAVAVLAVGRGRLRYAGEARRLSAAAAIPVVLIAIGVWRFFPPAEYVLGGKDPGVYMAEGIQIAQRGTLVYDDPVVASVPPFARDLFFPSHEQQTYYSDRFMAFKITDPDRGSVVGQFPHLFPASIAIGYGIDGLTGARRTVGVWAILGLLAFYFAASRLLGRTAAAAAAGLLTLNIAFIWFARYPSAEMVLLTFLWAALLANARAHVDGDRFFAPVAGALLALLLFLRYDTAIAVAAIVGAAGLGVFAGQRPRLSFFVVLIVLGGLAALYLFGVMPHYMKLPLEFATKIPWWQYVVGALAAAGTVFALTRGSRSPRLSEVVRGWTPHVLMAATIIAAVYALLFRHPGGKLVAGDAYALRTFTYLYLSLPALIGALIGYAIVIRRFLWRDPALILTITAFAFFLFYKPRIVPEHFWMARRFIPVLLPGALLFAAAAAFVRGPDRSARSRLLRPAIGILFIGILAAQYSRVSGPLIAHVEYADVIPRLEKLAGTFGDDDLVIVESRNAGGDVHVLATPLAYIYARNVLLLHSPKPDKPTFAAFLEWARSKYRRVFFIGSGGTDLLSHRYAVKVVASDRFQVPEYETTHDRLPRVANRKEFDFGVYEFTAAASNEGLWFDLDVGVQDDLHVVRFHAKEPTGDTTFRWTRSTSYITVTTLDASARTVTLWMSNGGRPAAAPPPLVEVYLHNQLLGTVRVDDGFRPYAVNIPPDLAARAAAVGDPVELKLVTRTWNPQKVLGTPDDRELGVMVDRVAVR